MTKIVTNKSSERNQPVGRRCRAAIHRLDRLHTYLWGKSASSAESQSLAVTTYAGNHLAHA